MLQAKSDLAAAVIVYKESDATTYCHAISKYQQATEKSVKGMVAALNELNISQFVFNGSHTLKRELSHLDAMRRRPNLRPASIGMIDRILIGAKSDILQLSALAPKLPGPGLLYPRNTEYPFNEGSAENWMAPAAPTAFRLTEVQHAHRLVWRLHSKVVKFTSSLRRRG